MTDSRVHPVLLVDDHPVTRFGLRHMFDREPDFAVCGEAGGLDEALDQLTRCTPDLVVTDLELEGRNGLDLVKHLHAHAPRVPTLVFSMYDAWLYARRALRAGARGYVEKSGDHEEILRAARAVLRGEVYLREPQTAGLPSSGPAEDHAEDGAVAALTDREFDVFMRLGRGYAPRHVAEELGLSVSTVEAYRERLKAKLGIGDSALLLRYAVRWLKDHEHGVLS